MTACMSLLPLTNCMIPASALAGIKGMDGFRPASVPGSRFRPKAGNAETAHSNVGESSIDALTPRTASRVAQCLFHRFQRQGRLKRGRLCAKGGCDGKAGYAYGFKKAIQSLAGACLPAGSQRSSNVSSQNQDGNHGGGLRIA